MLELKSVLTFGPNGRQSYLSGPCDWKFGLLYLGFFLFQETRRICIAVKHWTLSLGDYVLSWQRNRNLWWRATPCLSDHHRLLFHRRIKSMIHMYPRRRGSVLEPPLISCSFATSSSNMPDMIIYEYKVDKHEFRKTFVAFLNSA